VVIESYQGLMQQFCSRTLYIPQKSFHVRPGESSFLLDTLGFKTSCWEGIAQDAPLRPCLEGSLLFELCRFLYIGDIRIDFVTDPQTFFTELLIVSESIRIDRLYCYCLERLQAMDMSSKTFFTLEQTFSYDYVSDARNRGKLLELLGDVFSRNFMVISGHRDFTSIPTSTLIELIRAARIRLPSFITYRWNYYLDKSLGCIEKVSNLLGDDQDTFTSSLIEIKSGKVIAEGVKHKLSGKELEVLVNIPKETILTWRVDNLFKGRQLGLFNSLFLFRQTHAEGIYELQLQDGSANPPTAHLNGSSNSVVFNVIGGKVTSISIGHRELLSTSHQFRTFDIRLIHEGRIEGDTTLSLIDMYTLLL
jgi:hypothetical protein